MLLAHGPLSVILSERILRKDLKNESLKNKFLLFIFAFFIGILPDFDIFYLLASGGSVYDHHKLLTHTPIFWITTGILLYFITKKVFSNKYKDFGILITVIYIVGTLSHILADLLTGHINILFPILNHYFTIFGTILPDNLFIGYIGNPLFGLEILIISYFIFLMSKVFFKILKPFALFSIMIFFLYLIFNIIIYSQTYHLDTTKKETSGHPIFDTDRDGLADNKDIDTDNNFIDNYKQSNTNKLNEEITKLSSYEIVGRRKRNLHEDIYYIYGGFTIPRLIFQAYDDIGFPIQPLVKDYVNKNNITDKENALSEYLLSTETFKKVSFAYYTDSQLSNTNNIGPIAIYIADGTADIAIFKGNEEILYEDNLGILREVSISEFFKSFNDSEIFMQFYNN